MNLCRFRTLRALLGIAIVRSAYCIGSGRRRTVVSRPVIEIQAGEGF